MRISNRKIFLFLLGVCSVLIVVLYDMENSFLNKFIALETLLFCVINLWKSRNRIIEFIFHIQLFYYNYSVVFSRYLYKVDAYDEFYVNADERTLGIGILSLFIFEFCMVMFVREGIQNTNWKLLYAKRTNRLFSITILFMCILIGLLSFDWGSYGTRGAVSSSYEYMGLLFVLGLHFGGEKDKYIRYLYSLVILFFIIQGFIFGERVSSLQFMLIWVVFFLGSKIKAKHILAFCGVGLVLMTAIGVYRATYNLSTFSIVSVFKSIFSRMFTFDGADLGYYCSLTFVMVADIVSWEQRIDMFGKFLFSIIVGASNESNLSVFTRKFYGHWYGGFFPLYFYFYLGLSGVIIACVSICAFLNKCFKNIESRQNEFHTLLGVYIVCITARWYMYTPQSLIRPVILFAIGYFFLDKTNNLLKRK